MILQKTLLKKRKKKRPPNASNVIIEYNKYITKVIIMVIMIRLARFSISQRHNP
jgi:hypothetical protein